MTTKPGYSQSERSVLWTWLGRVEYSSALDLMDEIGDKVRRGETSGTLLFLEHPPTITLGRRAESEDIRADRAELLERGITVFRTDRGGKVTYHGPGQLVGYLVADVRAMGVGVKGLIRGIEKTLVVSLAKYGISAEIINGSPGIWVNGKKMAALGMRIKNHITGHGFALNVDCDLRPFGFINPCGMNGVEAVNLSEYTARIPSPAQVAEIIAASFGEVFDLNTHFVKTEAPVGKWEAA